MLDNHLTNLELHQALSSRTKGIHQTHLIIKAIMEAKLLREFKTSFHQDLRLKA